ncbi:hypothetical protein BDM02DRAFT_3183795 [Thelephora ganbajun]|uniref:Uncharacterized protein n=1 Tax=Thelephora ganbajun TaxID=370292 RepID=A0ACB6ZS08_THEGA|nr:hypothetical protein BDM02DRAFT_3183795 [Thelephora ganbajun]
MPGVFSTEGLEKMTTPTKRHSLPPRPLHLATSNIESFSETPSSSDVVPSLPTTPLPQKRSATKRQQSISYLPHNSDPRWSIRSPTTAALPPSISSEGRNSPAALAPQRENAPLTLAEKHADLLRFIAQKEAKCMELRTQLASQEDELAQLKRKWEKIVNRGFDRVYATNGMTPPQGTSGPVLEGIKEGVQEVSRMIAAGLGDYDSSPSNSTKSVPAPAKTHSTHQSTSSVTTSSSGSTQFSHSSANSSLVENGFPFEPPERGEVSREKTQARIFEEASQSPTYTPILENSTVVDISKTGPDEVKISKTLRRRSREVPSETTGRVPPKLGQVQQREGKSPMLPTSSMPGLGTLPSGTPLWVLGTVGKKWEELQRTETFTKSQKRASVLLADMSQSLLNAWSTPIPSPVIGASISANPFVASISPMQTENPIPEILATQTSLLDDDSDLQGRAGGLGVVMKPNTTSPSPSIQNKSDDDDDDDDWNW